MKKILLFILLFAIHYHMNGQTVNSQLGSTNSISPINSPSCIQGFQFPRKLTTWSNSKWNLGNTYFDSGFSWKLKYNRNGTNYDTIASERWVDSLFGTAVTGVTLAQLTDSLAIVHDTTRALRTAITALSGSGVTSFNTRTGAVTLTSGDVTGALGFTPENVANKATSFAVLNNTLYPTTSAVNTLLNTTVSGYFAKADSNTLKNPITLSYFNANVPSLVGYATRSDVHDSLNTLSGGTGISVATNTHVITNTAPDQTVTLTSGTGISATGTYPNFTITNTSPSSGGTVTSVTVTPTSPIVASVANSTTTPNISISLGTVPLANGGTNATTTTSVNGTPITYGASNTITASANTLTTTILNPTVVTSSLTSVGTVTSGTWSSSISSSATGSTQAAGDNSTKIATTAYVDRLVPADTTISAAYTLTSRDAGRTIHCTNGSNIALTVPTGLATTFHCAVIQEGAGTVTPTASSTTFYYWPTGTTKTKGVGAEIVIRSWATANSFTVQGAMQ